MEIKIQEQFTLKGVVKVDDPADVEPGDRMFYEIGKYIGGTRYSMGTWVRYGYLKEIKNPMEWVAKDGLFVDKEYRDHHNFVLLKATPS